MVSINFLSVPVLFFIVAFSVKLTFLFVDFFNIQPRGLAFLAAGLISLPAAVTVFNTSTNSELLKNKNTTIWFGVFSFLMWLLAFKIHQVTTAQWRQVPAILLLSAFLATTETVGAKLFKARKDREQSADNLQQSFDNLQQSVADLKQTAANLQQTVKDRDQVIQDQEQTAQDLQQFKKALQCGKCGKQHHTVHQFKTCKHENLKT